MNQVPIDCWRKFFGNFRKYYVEPSSPDKVIDIGATKAFFTQYEKRYKRFWESGSAINIWDVAGLKRNEVRNTAILAWLLDCHGSHGQGNAFLGCFLDCLKAIPENSEAYALNIKNNYLKNGYQTIPEKSFWKEQQSSKQVKKSRMDIVIDGKDFLLFIEAKIDAGEGEDQLPRYKEIIEICAGKRAYGLVFLTPDGRKDKDETEGVATLSWRQFAASLEKYVQDKSMKWDTQKWPLWVMPVLQFCQHTRTF